MAADGSLGLGRACHIQGLFRVEDVGFRAVKDSSGLGFRV